MKRTDIKDILRGEYADLDCVSKFLRHNGVGAQVRSVGALAVLTVDVKDAKKATVAGMAYVNETNRMRSRKLRVAIIEEIESEDEIESLLG